jgi:hypothetical protein
VITHEITHEVRGEDRPFVGATCRTGTGMLPAVRRATNPMPMTVHHEDGNVYRLEVQGLLRKLEVERCQDVLIEDMARVGPVRLLFLLGTFEGWAPHDDWHDLSFYMKYGGAIERIAIVGDERWRAESLMFAGADLRQAPVEFFSREKAADARAWLST